MCGENSASRCKRFAIIDCNCFDCGSLKAETCVFCLLQCTVKVFQLLRAERQGQPERNNSKTSK